MRILRIYEFIPPCPGGMEKHILRLSEEQSLLDNKVVIAYNTGSFPADSSIRILKNIPLRGIRPLFFRNSIFFVALICNLIFRKDSKFDAVHIHGDWGAFFFGRIIKAICGAKILVGSVHDKIKQGRLWDYIYKFSLRRYDFLYTTGKKEQIKLSRILDIPIYWQHSGIDSVFYTHNPKPYNSRHYDLCSVGSFVPKKNWGLQLDIAQRLPNLRFAMIGNGPLLDDIKNQCLTRSIENIHFFGSLTAAEVSSILHDSKIFLMTSYHEGTPTALMESLASGCAPVISNSNDYTDIIPNGAGLIVDSFTVESFIQSITHILSKISKMEISSQDIARDSIRFSWVNTAKNIDCWMKKMYNIEDLRIAQIITGLGIGGAERVTMELSSSLKARCHEIQIISLTNDTSIIDQYKDNPVPISTLGITKNPISFFLGFIKAAKILRRDNINIIHAHMFHALLLALLLKIINWKIKILFTSHSFAGFSKYRRLIILASKPIRSIDIIFNKNQHVDLNTEKFRVIPNCVSAPKTIEERRSNAADTFKFIFVGRLEHPKNPCLLLHQFSLIHTNNAELHIVGDGHLKPEMIALAQELKIKDRIYFHGKLNNVRELMLQSDCLVLSSRHEGLPMVILEAGTCGLPVISTAVGGIPEILSDNCGYLSEASELHQAMQNVITHRKEAMETGVRLFNRVREHYSLDAMVDAHIQAYNAALGATS